jgi:RNA polymerase sigma factor (sigma-70 family)
VQCAPPPADDFEDWEIRLLGHVVREFLSAREGSMNLSRRDMFPDFFQEAALHWWQRRAQYNPERGASRATFLRRVVGAHLRDLEREMKAMKRGGGIHPLSLDRRTGDEGAQTLGDLLEDERNTVWVEARLTDATAMLSPRQRQIVEALREGANRTEAAARAGISRETLYQELKRIRGIFIDAGLEEFLR